MPPAAANQAEADILYPPVSENISTAPDKKRTKGFVCVGWIIPQKDIESIPEILEDARGEGQDILLHFSGTEATAVMPVTYESKA